MSSTSQRRGPAALLDEVRADAASRTAIRPARCTARSVRITGMPAALASRSTVSQPVSTTGEKAITSTFCAMKERSALIWFSCFCCAVGELQLECRLGQRLLDRTGVGRAPLALGAHLAEAHGDGAVAGCRRLRFHRRPSSPPAPRRTQQRNPCRKSWPSPIPLLRLCPVVALQHAHAAGRESRAAPCAAYCAAARPAPAGRSRTHRRAARGCRRRSSTWRCRRSAGARRPGGDARRT